MIAIPACVEKDLLVPVFLGVQNVVASLIGKKKKTTKDSAQKKIKKKGTKLLKKSRNPGKGNAKRSKLEEDDEPFTAKFHSTHLR